MHASRAGQVDHVLRPAGFSRQRSTWNRSRAGFVDAIDIQLSNAKDSFTINVGVLDAEVYEIVWGRHADTPVIPPACFVQRRIGMLIDGKDRWWPTGSDDAVSEAAECVFARGLPFVDTITSRHEMRRVLREDGVTRKRYPPPILGLAALEHLLGDAYAAAAVLAVLRDSSSGSWLEEIEEVEARLRAYS